MSSLRAAIAVSTLAAYLLAVTAGSLFHTHGVAGCGSANGSACARGEDSAAATSARHASGCCPDYAATEPAGDPRPLAPDASDSCPVCHFQGHKPAPVEHVEEVTSVPLREHVEPPPVVRLAVGAPSSQHSRAPPCSV